MSNVIFGSLIFDKVGCCASHSWTEVRHDNGKVSTVYDNGDGSYSVVTHAANLFMRALERYDSQQGVEARLEEDAK